MKKNREFKQQRAIVEDEPHSEEQDARNEAPEQSQTTIKDLGQELLQYIAEHLEEKEVKRLLAVNKAMSHLLDSDIDSKVFTNLWTKRSVYQSLKTGSLLQHFGIPVNQHQVNRAAVEGLPSERISSLLHEIKNFNPTEVKDAKSILQEDNLGAISCNASPCECILLLLIISLFVSGLVTLARFPGNESAERTGTILTGVPGLLLLLYCYIGAKRFRSGCPVEITSRGALRQTVERETRLSLQMPLLFQPAEQNGQQAPDGAEHVAAPDV